MIGKGEAVLRRKIDESLWSIKPDAITRFDYSSRNSAIYECSLDLPGMVCKLKLRQSDLLLILYKKGAARRSVRIPLENIEDVINSLSECPAHIFGKK